MTKKKAIVLDIDGVILDSAIVLEEIYNLKLHGDEMWNYFHKHCNGPKVAFIESAFSLLESLDPNVYIILSTARNDRCRKSTEERLHDEGFPYDFLYMRKNEDYRPSPEVKKDHLELISQEFDVIAFIDDELTNCEMAKGEGIFALRRA